MTTEPRPLPRLIEGPISQDWFGRGACNGATDPDLWFPDSGESPEAKAICAGCGVREECLEYALLYNEKYGIWGGLNEAERRSLRRRRRRRAGAA